MSASLDRRGLPRVAVTGYGAVTPIGVGLPAFAAALRAGDCGVAPISRFDTSGFRSSAGAEVKALPPAAELRALSARTGLRITGRYGRSTSYALVALAEALVGAGLGVDDLGGRATGLVVGTSTAGTPESEAPLLGLVDDQELWSQSTAGVWLGTALGTTAAALAHCLRIGGPTSTISTACSSATNALGQALDWIRAGDCERVIVGGTDALCQLTHSGFNSLQLVAPERPLPFDARRQGMCIGEGAAFFVLERVDRATARGARLRGHVLGFGNIAEAHHLVQPDPSGAGSARAMQAALDDAGVEPARIDYVNAHGTATTHNDVAEGRGVHRVFGERADRLPVSSTKSQVGHLLGASGAVELAAVLLGMEHGFLPPTAGWAEKDEEIELDVVPGAGRPGRIELALSNSFAFGGNDSSLCVAHPDAELQS